MNFKIWNEKSDKVTTIFMEFEDKVKHLSVSKDMCQTMYDIKRYVNILLEELVLIRD